MKMRRRLGVSPVRVSPNGPATATRMHTGLHARMAILVEMRLVRLLRGFDQRGVLPHECRRDGMRPGRHVKANLEPLVDVSSA